MRRIVFSVILAGLLAVSASAACSIDYRNFEKPVNKVFPGYHSIETFSGVWAFLNCPGREVRAVSVTVEYEQENGIVSRFTENAVLGRYGMASVIFWTGPCHVKGFQVTELKEIASQTFVVGTDIPDRSQ